MLGNFPKVTQLVSNRTGTRILIFSLSLFFKLQTLDPQLPIAIQRIREVAQDPTTT